MRADGWVYRVTVALSGFALALVVAYIVLVQDNRSVQSEANRRQQFINQSMQLTFNLGFAFFSPVEGVVVRINHGGSPQRNAAMITSRGPLVRPGRSMTVTESRI